MNYDENEENIEQLKKIIQGERKAAMFVGAGSSIPLGVKSWKELLMEMARTFNSTLDVEASILQKGYPSTASDIYESAEDHDAYLRFLHDQCDSRNCYFTSMHLTVIRTIPTIITTNFDPAFEEAFADSNITFDYQQLPDFNTFTMFEKPTIVYLHGSSKNREYVFRKEEYDIYYPSVSGHCRGSHKLERFLQDLLSQVTLIFLAFSFNDTYFTEFLMKALKESDHENQVHESLYGTSHQGESVEHYAIVDESQRSKVKEMGLRVISYQKDIHKQIENILKRLQSVRVETASLVNASGGPHAE